MEQNDKKVFELRIEGNQILLVGVSGQTLAKVLAFRADTQDHPGLLPPQRAIQFESLLQSGIDNEEAMFLMCHVMTALEPNYPDNAYETTYSVASGSKDRMHLPRVDPLTLDALALAATAEEEGIVINGLPVIDRERMTNVAAGAKIFALTRQDTYNVVLKGTTRDTVGMELRVSYSIKGDLIYLDRVVDPQQKRAIGEYAIGLALVVINKLAQRPGQAPLTVVSGSGFFGEGLAALLTIRQEDGTVRLRPEVLSMAQQSIDDGGFTIVDAEEETERPERRESESAE